MTDQAFYESKKWKHIREKALKRDGYKCQISKRYGRSIPAEVVHHVLPKEQYPQYAMELWNLISITKERHNRLHDRENGELTKEGEELALRMCRRLRIKKGYEFLNEVEAELLQK